MKERANEGIKATTETSRSRGTARRGLDQSRDSLTESPHRLVHPVAALAARRALPAGFVLVEEAEPGDGLDDVDLLVHHDDGRSAEAGLRGNEGVEVHHDVVANPVIANNGIIALCVTAHFFRISVT